MNELKPLVKVLVGGGVRKLGKERASRQKDIFGDTKWVIRGSKNAVNKFNTRWFREDNPIRFMVQLDYAFTYEMTIEDIVKYVHAANGDLDIILKDPKAMDGKHKNIFNKCRRYIDDLPISICSRYLYNHPELLGGFIYDPNTKTIIKTYKGEEKEDLVVKIYKEKYGKSARKKITIEQYANSWSEDEVPEDSPYYQDKKKGN